MKNPRNQALTLVELGVAILIVSVLLAILLPAFTRSLGSRSSEIRCLNNLRRLGQAIHHYLGDHANTFPGPMYYGQKYEYAPGAKSSRHFLVHHLIGYLNTPVPSDAGTVEVPEFICPAWKAKEIKVNGILPDTCYAVTERIIKDGITLVAPFGNPRTIPVTQPARLTQIPGALSASWMMRDNFAAYAASGPNRFVHGQSRNYLFFDGHTKAVAVNPSKPNLDFNQNP